MGIFSWLLGQSNRKVVKTDPVFGEIEFDGMFWTQVPRGDYTIFVAASATGPSDRQRAFFQSVHARMKEFEKHAKDFMRAKDKNLDVGNLSIYSLIIESDDKLSHQEFSIEFSDDQADEIHHVEFSDEKPSSYEVDS